MMKIGIFGSDGIGGALKILLSKRCESVDIQLVTTEETDDHVAIIGGNGSILAEELRGNKNVKITEYQKNVGTVGNVLIGKFKLPKVIGRGKSGTNKSDRKRDRKNRWR